MIISASRRTDIPSYYSDWFFNRIKDGYVLVRNPMNIHQISKINLSAKVIDGIVFWTKNPLPMLNRLQELDGYDYYFQFTVNAYGKDVEPNIPSKNDVIVPAFQKLSSLIGKEKVVWRYDPIFINEKYTLEYHCKYFEALVGKLCNYTEKCTISFLDLYRNTKNNVKPLNIFPFEKKQMEELAERFSEIARNNGIQIDTCAEEIDLSKFDISHAHCIDKLRFERITNCEFNVEKDKTQREECGCVASIDIGTYNTCKNGCLYCYANYSKKIVEKNTEAHNPLSPLLFGQVEAGDKITEREMRSCKDCQMNLF